LQHLNVQNAEKLLTNGLLEVMLRQDWQDCVVV